MSKKNDNTIIALIEFLAVLLIVSPIVFRIKDFYGLYIIGDEFGYWNNAAWMKGWDWTDIAGKYNPYYSYGYSIFLHPLLFFKSSVTMYRLAIILNAVFLVGSYFLTRAIVHILFSDTSKYTRIIVSCTITLYTYNIFSALTTQSECCLLFFFWLLFYLTITEIFNNNLFKSICISIVSAMLVAIHMRAIGVVIAVGVVLLVATILHKDKWSNFFIYIFIWILLFIGVMVIKEYLQGNAYVGSMNMETNDFSGQTQKVISLFSLNGIREFVYSIMSKLWYIGCATFFISWLGIMECAIFIFNCIRDRKDTIDFFIALFAILSFGAALAIDAIAVRGSTVRADIIVYGRYMEYAVGPIILFGLKKVLYDKKVIFWQLCITIFGVIITDIVIHAYQYWNNPMMGYWNNSCSIAVLAYNQGKFQRIDYVEHVFLFSMFISWCILLLKRIKALRLLPFLIMGGMWLYFASVWSDDNIMSQQVGRIKDYDSMAQIVLDSDNERVIYITGTNETDDFVGLRADHLQFALRDVKMNVIQYNCEEKQLADIVNGDDYLIVNKDSIVYEIVTQQMSILDENENFALGTLRQR